MEFKGTKGKWSTNNHCVFVGDEEKIGENIICRLHMGTIKYMVEDQKYNALLISKAPEMLEMLKRVINDRLWGSDDDIEDIEKLIKEATEL